MVMRYGFTDKKIQQAIMQMSSDAINFKIGMTIPVTAGILNDRRAAILRAARNEFVEIAIHGYRHRDFSNATEQELSVDMENAIKIFRKYGIDIYGYRAPYLKRGANLGELLLKHGLLYDSSKPIIHTTQDNDGIYRDAIEIASNAYPIEESGNPLNSNQIAKGLIEIPVNLPDDEIIIDRIKIRDKSTIKSLLRKLIRDAIDVQGFVVLQIHPERYLLMRDVLLQLVTEIRKESNDIDFITLTTLERRLRSAINSNANKIDRAAICITGDLDIFSIWDLFK